MYIQSLKWLNEESQEAEVTISDGYISVLCFSYPFNKKMYDNLTEPIYCLNVENIVIANGETVYAKKSDTAFGYLICGKLVEKNNNIVLLGNIKLCLDDAYIPADIPENSLIEFSVSRLSIY